MTQSELLNRVREIVKQAEVLKDKHIGYPKIPVDYACIFTQTEAEYLEILSLENTFVKVLKETPSGLLLQIPPLQTVAGDLQVLKIRKPDPTRPELGDADFAIPDYENFKTKYQGKPGYKFIQKEGFVMIELMDPAFNVRVYFSNPPLDVQYGLV